MLGAALAFIAVFSGLLTASAPAPQSIKLSGTSPGLAVEVLPSPPLYALENGMSGEVARLYGAGISDIRKGPPNYRRALTSIRQARVLAFAAKQRGPDPSHLADRHFSRIVYVEEQLSELNLIDEQLEHPPDRTDQRNLLLQLRALLLHNLFLAVRGFLGTSEPRLIKETLRAYQAALEDADGLKHSLLVGYAAMLAERGSFREARINFAKLSEHERDQEGLDIAVAYYYLALGDRGRAIARLNVASRRDTWMHGNPGREGHTFRSQVYRMNDFDRLRDHPGFTKLVTEPEERDQ